MTDKQLRKAKKTELLEMLYYMRKELDKVQEENSLLHKQLGELVSEALSVKNNNSGTDDADHE
ncbi:MAG: hypothetical protein K6G33_02765 [Ruminococcus sp.]|uniref:hypothetical protein n=1 Tax=Ruminococcus sp. TaxID=41978 RepID=UPI0025EA12A0|nr:hypothetical protein [Ruminococcus sp.]MCR5599651.1 hypothetical protein [Ruminococcus sp.]